MRPGCKDRNGIEMVEGDKIKVQWYDGCITYEDLSDLYSQEELDGEKYEGVLRFGKHYYDKNAFGFEVPDYYIGWYIDIDGNEAHPFHPPIEGMWNPYEIVKERETNG